MTDKEKRILRHIQTMSVLVTCMEIEFFSDLVDYRFKEPTLNNHIRRLKESIEQIRKGLSFKYKVIDRDLMENTHGAELHRVFTYFSTMATEQVTEIMDGFEQLELKNGSYDKGSEVQA